MKLYKRTEKGREVARNHPLYSLLTQQPNDYMTAVEFMESVAVGIASLGQAYNRVHRRPDGVVHAIEPVIRYRVNPEIQQNGELIYWYTTRNGQRLSLKREDICPVRGFGNVGELEGFSPVRLHRNTLALAVAVEKYGAQFFGSGGRPSGVLTTEFEFKKEQRESIRKNFAEYVRDSFNSGELPLLEKGLKYQPVTTPNNDAQFIETRKQQVADVARIWRVPLSLLMEADKMSYNNTQQGNKHFLDYTMMPYLIRIEQSFDSCLLTEKERKEYYFQFDVRGLLRGDSTERADYYVKMRTAGALTANDIRDLEDYPRVEGADDLLAPLNMAPIDTLRERQRE